MTDLTRLVAISEGYPAGLPASDVWEAALLSRERRRGDMMALGLSICNAIGVNLAGGDTSAVMRPFYSSREWDEMMADAEEARQLAAQRMQIAKLRRMFADG